MIIVILSIYLMHKMDSLLEKCIGTTILIKYKIIHSQKYLHKFIKYIYKH